MMTALVFVNVLSLFLEMNEEGTASGAHWLQNTIHACGETPLADSAVDFAQLKHWCDTPDVIEGGVGELASPFHGNTDTAT